MPTFDGIIEEIERSTGRYIYTRSRRRLGRYTNHQQLRLVRRFYVGDIKAMCCAPEEYCCSCTADPVSRVMVSTIAVLNFASQLTTVDLSYIHVPF